MYTVAVKLSGAGVWEVAVPDHVGLLGQHDAGGRLGGVGRVEEAQFDARGVAREDGEVDAESGPGRPQGIRLTWPDAQKGYNCSKAGPERAD